MTSVVTGHSTSLDGCIAGADDSPQQPLGVGGDRLFDWFSDGDTPSRFYPDFRMSAASAAFFDEYAARVGAVVTGRRTYDVSEAWGGSGPLPGVPLFVLTHQVPTQVPPGDPSYTFVTNQLVQDQAWLRKRWEELMNSTEDRAERDKHRRLGEGCCEHYCAT